MIAYEIVKKRPQTTLPYTQPYRHTIGQGGLFERLRKERELREKKSESVIDHTPAPVFDLRPFSMPYTDELVTELRAKGVDVQANPPSSTPIAMGKLQYARWLSAFVYPYFQKNQLVTFKTIPIVLNTVPTVFFVVTDIQEIHYSAQVDKETREPRAVGISLPGKTIPSYYPPAILRELTPSEIQAINDKLRNQAREGRVLEATVTDDGIATVVDRSTGEVLKQEE